VAYVSDGNTESGAVGAVDARLARWKADDGSYGGFSGVWRKGRGGEEVADLHGPRLEKGNGEKRRD
jgi:hypothetical protein